MNISTVTKSIVVLPYFPPRKSKRLARAEEDARYAEADRMDAVLAELLAPMTEAEQFEMEM